MPAATPRCPTKGLAIWHVDEDGDNSHEQMTSGSHYELSLEQADGLFQLERQRNQIGDAGDLFAGADARFADTTVPDSKWWNGTSSNLTIEQISTAGAVDHVPLPALGDAVTPPHDAHADIDAEPRDSREQPGRHHRHDRHRRGADDLEPQSRRRHHAYLSWRSERHADDAVGNRDRAASEGPGRQRRRPEGDLRRDDAAGAGDAARAAARRARWRLMVQGPGAGRHRQTEPVVAGVLGGRRMRSRRSS